MLILNPEIVRFDSLVWEDVCAVAIERIGTKIIEDHDDRGPFAAFVDVSEQSIKIRVTRAIAADDVADIALGTPGELVFYAASAADDRRRRRIAVSCVVVGTRVEPGAGAKPPTKTLLFRAVSASGDDPVVIDTPPHTEA